MSNYYNDGNDRDKEKLKTNLSLIMSMGAAASASAAEREAKAAKEELSQLRLEQEEALEEERLSREAETARRQEWEIAERTRNEAVLNAPQALFEVSSDRDTVQATYNRVVSALSLRPKDTSAVYEISEVVAYNRRLQQIDPLHLTRFEDKKRHKQLSDEASSWLEDMQRRSAELIESLTEKEAHERYAGMISCTRDDYESFKREVAKFIMDADKVASQLQQLKEKDKEFRYGSPYSHEPIWQYVSVGAGMVCALSLLWVFSEDPEYAAGARKIALYSFLGCLATASLHTSVLKREDERRKASASKVHEVQSISDQAEAERLRLNEQLRLFEDLDWNDDCDCWCLKPAALKSLNNEIRYRLFYGRYV